MTRLRAIWAYGEFHARPDGRLARWVDDDAIDRILAELDDPLEDEHPGVSLQQETGWGLSAFQGGLVVWQNVEDDSEPRHMKTVSRDRVRRLFRLVAGGHLELVEAEPWLTGHG